MFKNTLLEKFLIILVLSLFLCVPLGMVGATVAERQANRDGVRADIAATFAGNQTLAGPVLVLPYRQRITADDKDHTTHWEPRLKYWLPEQLDIRGSILPESHYRGIYRIQAYRGAVSEHGYFDLLPTDLVASDDIVWGTPFLAMEFGDTRGIVSTPVLKVNDQAGRVEAGAGISALPSGVHADLPALRPGRMTVDLNMDIKGTEELDFLPMGRETTVSLSGSWPHPSFVGHYLPDAPDVNEHGFTARWTDNFLSNGMETLFANCMNQSSEDGCLAFHANSHGVRLIDALNVYLQTERARKYGFLFVALTFAAFFLFEIMKGMRIHPVQYSLVGGGLVLFFLLLISLAEHIPFARAYALSAAACIGLITFYTGYVLRGIGRALGFGALLSALYGALYGLLLVEDYALLLGTLLLFVLLAAVMVLTRNFDWYKASPPAISSTMEGG